MLVASHCTCFRHHSPVPEIIADNGIFRALFDEVNRSGGVAEAAGSIV